MALDLCEMAGSRPGRGLVHALDEVDVLYIGPDVLATGSDVIRVVLPFRLNVFEGLVQGGADVLHDQRIERIELTGFECPVGSRDCRTEITASRLEPGVRGALSGAMQSHHR